MKWENPAGGRPGAPSPSERSGPAAAPLRPRGPAEPRRETRTPSRGPESGPPAVAPREPPRTQPERVKIPSSPVVDKPVAQWGKSRKAPPPTPSGERKNQGKPQPKERREQKGSERDKQAR